MYKNKKFYIKRLEKILKYKIYKIFFEKINDKRIKYINITKIKLLLDYSEIRIYVIFLNNENFNNNINILNKTTNFIKKKIFKFIKYKIIPKLIFIHDDNYIKLNNLMNIINDLNN